MARETCPQCGADKPQLMACPRCGYCRRPSGAGLPPSVASQQAQPSTRSTSRSSTPATGGSMKAAMLKAYEAQGTEPPSRRQTGSTTKAQAPSSKVVTKAEIKRLKTQSRLMSRRNLRRDDSPAPQKTSDGRIVIDAPMIQRSQPKPQPLSSVEYNGYQLRVSPNVQLKVGLDQSNRISLLHAKFLLEYKTQCCHGQFNDEREVVLGLDFGTSSTKVVIGDSALGQAFAVPFTNESGINRYLLPCRIYESRCSFGLEGGSQVYRDLKLSLIAQPTHLTRQIRVVSFLAYVIRYARAWLLSEHADKYRNTLIYWRLRIGLPAAQHLDNELSHIFETIGKAAWLASVTPGNIIHSDIDAMLLRCKKLMEGNDIEVQVVPEIAAQIYGFVNSRQFNSDDKNLYLMVDVGAGSVDSSLFQVKKARGGRWDFEFFTSVVEPHGVMNLHRYRVDWWKSALQKNGINGKLSASLDQLKFATDREFAIPESYLHYFEGVEAIFHGSELTPDRRFYGKIDGQVRAKTYWQTWRNNLLTQNDLKGIPAFYCGGGMRMPFYSSLQQALRSCPNMTWLSAHPHRIELPSNLDAPGVLREDYDRLTVAYGLSFLEVGKVIKAIPNPRLVTHPESCWRDHYPDKDFC